MTSENTQKLLAAGIYQEGFQFECGDGWFALLLELSTELAALGVRPGEVMQVKEKFGGLRFYVWRRDAGGGLERQDPVEAAVLRAEEKALTTCGVCGEPGRMDGRGWWQILCPAHAADRQRTRMMSADAEKLIQDQLYSAAPPRG